MRRPRKIASIALGAVGYLAAMTTSGCGEGTSTPPPVISVSFTGGNSQTVAQGQAFNLTANISNDPSGNGVTWKLTGSGTLSKQTSTSVEYDAPASVTSPVTATVTATAVADPSKSAPFTLTITPPPSFSLAVNPPAIYGTVGTFTPPIVISAASQYGFSGAVSVAISGLPPGVTTVPSSPLNLMSDTTQEVVFSIPDPAQTGSVTPQFTATSGQLSKTASLTLTIAPAPVIQTYQSGPMLYLEATTANETTRVGLLTTWGGSAVEVSVNGVNIVNANDPARELQAGLWDGNVAANTLPFWGVVQAGDHDYDGSPVLTQHVGPDSIYVKTQPLQWVPENFGGGSGNPVLADFYIEQWLTPVPGHGRAFKIHYKITHFGMDTHANAGQEFPAVYVNRGWDTFVYYGGTEPWTYKPLSNFTMPDLPHQGPLLYTPEEWGAYVDANDSGLTVYTPGSFLYTHGFNAAGASPDGTNYFVPVTPFTWAPGAVLESNIYMIAGPVSDARAILYEMRHQETNPSPFTAVSYLEEPQSGDTLSGPGALVGGWAFGTSDITRVDVLVDGTVVGTATHGLSR